jgi:ribosome-binding factor A
MVDGARARKLAGRIKQIVASMIETQVKDPRLGMVTITDVRMTGDLHDATVFYTVLGDSESRQASMMALESARGVLRSEVGRQTGVRFTPTITFVLDEVPEAAAAIEDLLAAARAADAEVERVREGATFAGDPNPYKEPRVIPDDDDLEDEDEDVLDDDLDDSGNSDEPPTAHGPDRGAVNDIASR